jgi:hypothetical protein
MPGDPTSRLWVCLLVRGPSLTVSLAQALQETHLFQSSHLVCVVGSLARSARVHRRVCLRASMYAESLLASFQGSGRQFVSLLDRLPLWSE